MSPANNLTLSVSFTGWSWSSVLSYSFSFSNASGFSPSLHPSGYYTSGSSYSASIWAPGFRQFSFSIKSLFFNWVQTRLAYFFVVHTVHQNLFLMVDLTKYELFPSPIKNLNLFCVCFTFLIWFMLRMHEVNRVNSNTFFLGVGLLSRGKAILFYFRFYFTPSYMTSFFLF